MESSPPPIPIEPSPPGPQTLPNSNSFRGKVQCVLYTLFSHETRTGRILRPVLRWAGTITGLFALGLLTGYLALYQPSLRENADLSGQLSLTQNQLRTRESDLASRITERDALQKKLAQSEAELSTARARNDLLWVLDDVNNARVALVNKDGVAAKNALDQAQMDLARVLPTLEKADKNMADITKSRLELASKELVIDPQAAQADLNKLQSDLVSLINRLFK